MSGIKVGDRLWRFDINRRVYNGSGMNSRIIYAEHFTPHTITGETVKSWLIAGDYGDAIRVSKSELREAGKGGYGGHQWFTDSGREDDIWRHVHRSKITDLVDRADPALLRKVAEVVGYQANG